MKYSIIAASLALFSINHVSATSQLDDPDDLTLQQPDTVLCVKNAHNVVITETSDGICLDVFGEGNDSTYHSTCAIAYDNNAVIKSHQSFSMPLSLKVNRCNNVLGFLQGLHFGFTGAIDAPAAMNTQMGKSFEIGIDNIAYFAHKFGPSKRNAIQVGVGVNWRNYRMTGDNRFDLVDGNTIITDYPADTDGKFSRIKAFSLSFPIAYSYTSPVKALGKSNLGFKFSAFFNWNSHASMLTQYVNADGEKVKENYDRIGHRKFSIDMQLGVQVACGVCLYVKYSPYHFFKSSTTSPKFQTISTGISFGF